MVLVRQNLWILGIIGVLAFIRRNPSVCLVSDPEIMRKNLCDFISHDHIKTNVIY